MGKVTRFFASVAIWRLQRGQVCKSKGSKMAASAYLKLDMCETPQQTAEMNASHKERVEKRAQEE